MTAHFKAIATAALVTASMAGLGVLNASSASAAPGYIGPKTCYMKNFLTGYDNKSKMVATAWPYNGGRRYHLAFYENPIPNGTNWNNFYIYVSGVGWVLKQSDHPDDNNTEERYVDMPTNVTHTLNAKWTRFLGGIPVGVSYCYGTKPVL
jgi:hypothetical protein